MTKDWPGFIEASRELAVELGQLPGKEEIVMNQERSIANVFMDHPAGVRVHYQIVEGTDLEQLMGLSLAVDHLVGTKLDEGYTAAVMQDRGQRAKTEPAKEPTPIEEETEEEESDTPVCNDCGARMTYKTGTSKKTGKPWQGYFCPKDREHPAVWV